MQLNGDRRALQAYVSGINRAVAVKDVIGRLKSAGPMMLESILRCVVQVLNLYFIPQTDGRPVFADDFGKIGICHGVDVDGLIVVHRHPDMRPSGSMRG